MHSINNFNKKEEVIAYINEHLEGYEGYVQFSHRPIDISKDVFIDTAPKVTDETGFISEAHFSNGKESIAIRQLNATWRLSATDITEAEVETFYAIIAGLKVKMAQIWEFKKDEYCEGMDVLTIDNVVFAGFSGGKK